MDEDVVPGEIYNGQTYVVRYLWRVKLNSDMVFVYLSLDSGDGREICFIVIQVYNGIQHHHNALFFNGFDAMLSNIGHGGGMADYSG